MKEIVNTVGALGGFAEGVLTALRECKSLHYAVIWGVLPITAIYPLK